MLDLKSLVKRCQNGEQFEYLLFWGHTPSKDGKITKACFRRTGDSPRVFSSRCALKSSTTNL
jgi:hypothetical protein